MLLVLALHAHAASSPYGVPVDGFPSHAERWLVLWTNAARVAPTEFTDEYAAGGCSTDDFADDEKVAKGPYYIDLALTEVARVHSIDMKENGCFQHESCDGTDPFERIADYYTDNAGAEGENIAMGTTDPRYAVLSMWMCSHDGHRANIMSGDFNEMGGGIDAEYLTQDFAAGELKEGSPPVRMAVDEGGVWYADWGDADPPATLEVVRDGLPTPLSLANGTPELGLYAVEAPDELEADCHSTYVHWKTAGGIEGTFPGTGSFLDGDCSADGHSPNASGEGEDWTDIQAQPGGIFGEVDEDELTDVMGADVELVGCAATGARGSWAVVGAALALALRRPRR